MSEQDPLRHIAGHKDLHGAFGPDKFGAIAERIALFFGTPTYIIVQSIVVVFWVLVNALGFIFQWDPYPFVFLNLAFSLQAAYAAPLILLAQTRQAEREKHAEEAAAIHREEVAKTQLDLIQGNTDITTETHSTATQVKELTEQVSAAINAR
jgi:uncharacterized membrane protein